MKMAVSVLDLGEIGYVGKIHLVDLILKGRGSLVSLSLSVIITFDQFIVLNTISIHLLSNFASHTLN